MVNKKVKAIILSSIILIQYNSNATRLHKAVRRFNFDDVQHYLDCEADINQRDKQNEAPVHVAWRSLIKSTEIIKFCLHMRPCRSCVNIQTPFELIEDLFRYLFKHQKEKYFYGSEESFSKITIDKDRILKLFRSDLYHGSGIVVYVLKCIAAAHSIGYSFPKIVSFIFENKHDFLMPGNENGEGCDYKKSNGESVKRRNYIDKIHERSLKELVSSIEMFHFLIDRGADINAAYENKETILHRLCKNKDTCISLVIYLILNGADVNQKIINDTKKTENKFYLMFKKQYKGTSDKAAFVMETIHPMDRKSCIKFLLKEDLLKLAYADSDSFDPYATFIHKMKFYFAYLCKNRQSIEAVIAEVLGTSAKKVEDALSFGPGKIQMAKGCFSSLEKKLQEVKSYIKKMIKNGSPTNRLFLATNTLVEEAIKGVQEIMIGLDKKEDWKMTYWIPFVEKKIDQIFPAREAFSLREDVGGGVHLLWAKYEIDKYLDEGKEAVSLFNKDEYNLLSFLLDAETVQLLAGRADQDCFYFHSVGWASDTLYGLQHELTGVKTAVQEITGVTGAKRKRDDRLPSNKKQRT